MQQAGPCVANCAFGLLMLILVPSAASEFVTRADLQRVGPRIANGVFSLLMPIHAPSVVSEVCVCVRVCVLGFEIQDMFTCLYRLFVPLG